MPTSTSFLSRRRFLKKTALGAATTLALPQLVPGVALGKDGRPAASERITIGGLGLQHRGRHDLHCLMDNPDVQVVADCDIQKSVREMIKADVDKKYGNNDCRTYADMFELLGQDDIDAVLIATGDRWHTMASITAAKAGKDIYCEKPCSMTISESRALGDTMKRYGTVYQAGTQRRNIDNFTFAMNLARNGVLGKLHTVHANTLNPATHRQWLPAEPEPAKVDADWDRWLGPCPWRPFNRTYLSGGWRGHYDFHGGGILEWGAHTVDLCQHAVDADDSAPIEYTPDGGTINCKYANGVKLVMRDNGWLGLGTCSVRFEGEDGWIETGDSGKIQVAPASLRSLKKIIPMAGTDPRNHLREWLDCIKTRKTTKSNASVVAQSHVACHAAYIAWQLGTTLKFDPVKEEFIDNPEANRMRERALRQPWHV